MIWLTWRQHRKQALYTLAGLLALAALIVPTGLSMRGTYADKGLRACLDGLRDGNLSPEASNTCMRALDAFNDQYGTLTFAGVLLLVLPLLVGLFWGAPLVARETEQGTHRLVWTQGISRRRWALVKVAAVGGFTLAVAVVYGLGTSWWMAPLMHAGQLSRFESGLFDMQGIAPIGYTLFAVALGVFAGTVWHKVLPAMGVALAGFAVLRIALTVLLRPRLMPPKVRTYLVEGNTGERGNLTGDWVLAKQVRNPDGSIVASNTEVSCPPGVTGPGGKACGADLGLQAGAYNWQQYQPGDRFWLFQSIEAGVFVALAILLFYLAIRRVRRIA
ncbi:ABC transporter permease subunit [Phytohabitans aurantiacus]|uniref:Transporter n=1 Tax=Phytohabitans aurantiacus TaxID=3016789 RepID=A0ABQ5R791_9ACTN|nr:ABC transporter permease subunit [Phytohabitans aurantiacus]GLI02627.1 transporter [Phytohabitans aurantiacus]